MHCKADFECISCPGFVGPTGSLALNRGLICAHIMPSDGLLFLGELAQSAEGRKAFLVTQGNPPSISERGVENALAMPTWKVKVISLKDI